MASPALHAFFFSFGIRVFSSKGGSRQQGVTVNGRRGCRRVQIRGGRHVEPPRRRFPIRFPGGKAPFGRYCRKRRERGKYDPSRAGGVPGRSAAGRGDRAVLPGFAGAAGWRPAVVAGALSAGTGPRSIGGPGHNEDRSRTPGHSPPPGRPVDAVALRGPASTPFRRTGQPRLRMASAILAIGKDVRFFGPSQKARSAANRRGSPIPASAPSYSVVRFKWLTPAHSHNE